MSTTVLVADVKVRQDKHGRFSLNDLHKAAVAAGANKRTKEPGKFLASQSVKDFIVYLDTQNKGIASVESIKGGKNQGTYAVELVAIRYAAWIDPEFEIRVYQSFQALAKGEIEKALAIATRQIVKDEYRPMTNAIKESREIEGKEVKHFHFANENNMIYKAMLGVTAKKYKEVNETDSVRDSLTPVELKCLESLQRANTTMLELGYDYEKRKAEIEHLYNRLWLKKLTEEHIRLEA